MIQFILKVILSIFTGILDLVINWVITIVAVLLWEKRWIEVPNFILTRMIWNKNMTITDSN
jgi:hypothetical protein